eukprot:scaffold57142_cov36-Phaeocystis_antarctica.AAC.2
MVCAARGWRSRRSRGCFPACRASTGPRPVRQHLGAGLHRPLRRLLHVDRHESRLREAHCRDDKHDQGHQLGAGCSGVIALADRPPGSLRDPSPDPLPAPRSCTRGAGRRSRRTA